MLIRVFVLHRVRIAHYHPHLHVLPESVTNERPYLGQAHEHNAIVKVEIIGSRLTRENDLLILAEDVKKLLSPLKVHQFHDASFEQICFYVKQEIPRVSAVEIIIDECEGARIDFNMSPPDLQTIHN